MRRVFEAGIAYCDVRYDGLGVVIELDGRLGHSYTADRWRAGWWQVLDPCPLARTVATVLRARGWTGSPHPPSSLGH